MKKPALILGALGVLVVAAALAFRFASSSNVPPDAGVVADAGASAQDAGTDAGIVVDAGAPKVPRQWTLNPRVSTSAGDSFATLQEAIDSAHTGYMITVPSGVYVQLSPLRIVEKTRLSIVAKGGPAYVRFHELPEGEAGLQIAQSSELTLEGLAFDWVGAGASPPAMMRATDTQNMTVRRSELSGADNCVHLERARDVVLESVLVGPCGATGVNVLDSRGALVVSKSRIFSSGLGLGIFESAPSDSPVATRVANTAITNGIGFGGFTGKVELTSSIVSTRIRAALDAVRPFFGDSPVEVTEALGTPSDELRKQWSAALAAGKSVLVALDPPPNAEQLGDAPGTDFSWALSHDDRLAAELVAGRPSGEGHEEVEGDSLPNVEEGPIVVGDGMSVPLCGVGEKLKVYPTNGGGEGPSKELDTCEQLGGDIGTVPEMYTLSSVTRTWIQIRGSDGSTGYVLAKDIHAAEEIDTGTTRILMPGYKCERGFSKAKDSILVRCASDACSGETCSYEEEGQITTSGSTTVMRDDHEIPLPEGATIKKTDSITKNFTPLCCT